MIRKLLLSLSTILIATLTYGQSISMSPVTGNRGQSLPIVISGNGTNFHTQGTNLFLVQGSSVIGQGSHTAFTNITVIDPLTILGHLHIPQNASLGSYDLILYSGTTHYRPNAFTVQNSSNALISMNPNGSKPANTSTVQVTIPGGSFKQAQVVESAWLTHGTEIIESISNIQVVNSTTLSMDITVPSGATQGYWNMNIYTDATNMYTTPNAFIIDNSFGIFEANKVELELYPNPAGDQVVLKGLQQLEGELEIRFMDISGRSFQGQHPVAADELTLDISHLPSGLYLFQLYEDGILQNSTKLMVE